MLAKQYKRFNVSDSTWSVRILTNLIVYENGKLYIN